MNYCVRKPKTGYKFVKGLFGKYEEIPKKWEKTKLFEICSEKGQYGAGIPAIEKNLKFPRYIRITDLNNDGSLRNEEWKSISEQDAKDYILIDNDILFARTGATVGKTFLYEKNHGRCAFAGYLIRFKLDKHKVVPKFLFYWTQSKNYLSWLLSIQTWGVQPNVNSEQYSRMSFLLPTILEQTKIASILSGVDALIQNTSDIIEKTEKLKKGLMQKLLIKGIEHTRFKKIPWMFGKEIEIPEEWEDVSVKHIANKLFSGGTPSTKIDEYWQGNIPWTRGAVLNANNTTKGEKFISQLGLHNSSTSIVPKDNLLVVSRVSIGNVSMNRIDIAISQDITAIILDKTRCLTEFLYWNLLQTISILTSRSQGTTIQGFTKTDLSNHKILLPPLSEQQKIASILSGVDAYIQKNQEYKEKLERLKKGLMQKLLTGQIRVNV